MAVAFCFVHCSRTVTIFTPGKSCGIATEIKAISGKGGEDKEEDKPCTLWIYLDESGNTFHSKEKGTFGAIATYFLCVFISLWARPTFIYY